MRLFIAIDISDEVNNALEPLRKPLSKIPGARISTQPHLTLKFLGDIEEHVAEKVAYDLAQLRAKPFTLYLTNTGGFPTREKPRVVYVGTQEPPPLRDLARVVDVATSYIKADKPFVPHITLARLKMPTRVELPDEGLKDLSFSVKEFILYESKQEEDGHVYSVVRKYALR